MFFLLAKKLFFSKILPVAITVFNFKVTLKEMFNVSAIPAAVNLPPVSTTRVENLPPVSRTTITLMHLNFEKIRNDPYVIFRGLGEDDS